MNATWKYLSDNDIRISAPIEVPTLQRERDSFIMEAFYDANLPLPVLRAANRCRMYLQLVTVADLATGNGSRLRRDAWIGQSGRTSKFIIATSGRHRDAPPTKIGCCGDGRWLPLSFDPELG